MIEVFKVALAQWLLFYQWIWLILQIEGIAPSCCRLTTRPLGATLFKVEIISNMQVSCCCKHAPWHLGANAKSFFAHFIKDLTHHIVNELALRGYQLLLSKIQGTQALIHYIERSTTQLVEYKVLNLVDVGSSPMVEITSYDVIINESYAMSQLSNILLSRPLVATRCCSSLHDHIYKVPAHYCIMTRPLGATLVEVFMSIRQL